MAVLYLKCRYEIASLSKSYGFNKSGKEKSEISKVKRYQSKSYFAKPLYFPQAISIFTTDKTCPFSFAISICPKQNNTCLADLV